MEQLELTQKLDAYTKELDTLVQRMELSGFPFGDAPMIYAEVSSRLKDLLKND